MEWGQIPSFSKWWARIPRVSKVTVQITWVCNISGQITWATFSPNCAKSGPDYLEDQITWSRPKAGQITWARPKWAGRFPGQMVFFSGDPTQTQVWYHHRAEQKCDRPWNSISIYLSIYPPLLVSQVRCCLARRSGRAPHLLTRTGRRAETPLTPIPHRLRL